MTQKQRTVVLPSQFLGEVGKEKPGRGTFVTKGKIYAERLGVLQQHSGFVNVVPITGIYTPMENDFVIGIVLEAMGSSWLVDINAPYPALLHVNEVPWKVDFGDTEKYLNEGDAVMAKVLQVDEQKKLNITLNDRNLYKIRTGTIIEVGPSKVPRIIGKKGSMIALLKKYTRTRIFVGQNGRVWIEGDNDGIALVLYAMRLIEEESLSYGLTNKVESYLKQHTKDVR